MIKLQEYKWLLFDIFIAIWIKFGCEQKLAMIKIDIFFEKAEYIGIDS